MTQAELAYKGSCPYCRTVAFLVSIFDLTGYFTFTDITTRDGRERVKGWHNGEYINAPHLRYSDGGNDRLVWGVVKTAKATLWRLGKLTVFTHLIPITILWVAGVPALLTAVVLIVAGLATHVWRKTI